MLQSDSLKDKQLADSPVWILLIWQKATMQQKILLRIINDMTSLTWPPPTLDDTESGVIYFKKWLLHSEIIAFRRQFFSIAQNRRCFKRQSKEWQDQLKSSFLDAKFITVNCPINFKRRHCKETIWEMIGRHKEWFRRWFIFKRRLFKRWLSIK